MEGFATASMFAPQIAKNKVKAGNLLPTRMVSKVRVVVFPSTLTQDEARYIGLAFAVLGASTTGSSDVWKSYLVSYTCFLFPELGRKLDSNAYEVLETSLESVRGQLDLIARLEYEALNAEDDSKDTDTALSNFVLHTALPALGEIAGGQWVGVEAKIKQIYCHYATVLFLAGKKVSDARSRAQITTSRPLALISKYHLDDPTVILTGTLRLSDYAHEMLNLSWDELGAFKIACITRFADFGTDATNLPQDIIFTNLQLLKFSGMAHALINYKFLKAYPWAVEIPVLRSSIVTFIDSVAKSAKVEAKLQPFVKMMYGDKTDLFPRKEMEPLIACAVAAETDVHESLSGYYTTQKFGPVVEAFLEERQDRERIRNRAARGLKARDSNSDVEEEVPSSEDEEGSEGEEDE